MHWSLFLMLPVLRHAQVGSCGELRDASVDYLRDVKFEALVASEGQARGRAGDAWGEVADAPTCSGCQSALALLKGLAVLGDRVFVDTLQEVCKLSGVEDDDVCQGAIALEGPIIAGDIREMRIPSRTADEFCVTFLGFCEYPKVRDWVVPLPSKKGPDSEHPSPSGQTPIKVVHFSDIHIDPLYVEGSNTECTKPICCRLYTAQHGRPFAYSGLGPYAEGDEPGKPDAPAGPNGDHRCDVPVSLERSMYAAIKDIVPDAAFTVFTGDMVDHSIWNTSQQYNEDEIVNAYTLMDDYLGLVYGTAGNHEAHPTNAYESNTFGNATQWLYDVLSEQWSRWIDSEAAVRAQIVGTYSAKFPDGKLRVISLNTNMYYRQNYWLYRKEMEKDPNGQIEWLAQELEAAERAGDRAYIIGHTPLGDHNAFHDASNYLDQVINRYSSTVAAMFFGHTHKDQFQITYSNYSDRTSSNALVTSYVGPSLTPTSGMPSFRVYDVDPVTFAVLDATTYMADMTNEAFQTTGPVWTKFYSAKETYGPLVQPPITDQDVELSAAFWHNVTVAFESSPALFDDYRVRQSRGWLDAGECDEACRANEICQLRAARSQDNCYEPRPGVYFAERVESRVENRDECGISVSRAALSSLAVRSDTAELMQRRLMVENGVLPG